MRQQEKPGETESNKLLDVTASVRESMRIMKRMRLFTATASRTQVKNYDQIITGPGDCIAEQVTAAS